MIRKRKRKYEYLNSNLLYSRSIGFILTAIICDRSDYITMKITARYYNQEQKINMLQSDLSSLLSKLDRIESYCTATWERSGGDSDNDDGKN